MPIEATPPVTGPDADRILRELREGTPDTPERRELMERADRVYREATTAREDG